MFVAKPVEQSSWTSTLGFLQKLEEGKKRNPPEKKRLGKVVKVGSGSPQSPEPGSHGKNARLFTIQLINNITKRCLSNKSQIGKFVVFRKTK